MSMVQGSPKHDRCYTCEYWQGERALPKGSMTNMTYEGGSHGCDVTSQKRSGTGSPCPKFKRWVRL